MTARWKFHNPVRISFGVDIVPAAMAQLPGRRLLLITTPGMTRRGRTTWLREVSAGKVAAVFDGVAPNPTLAALDALATAQRGGSYDGIVALGGGSALDTGKILGVLLGASADFSLAGHFLRDQPLPAAASLPVVAIPTTAGTGSEVTPFATVWDDQSRRKFSLAGERMFPTQALLDPTLTHELPWDVTLATGLDALCQAFESIWNRNMNPVSLGFAMQAAQRAWPVLLRGREVLGSPQLRSELMEASLLAGLAISHTRTALCHSMSYPVTAHFGLPHGLACGFTLSAVLRFNTAVDDGRLQALAQQLGCAQVEELAEATAALLRRLEVDVHLRSILQRMEAVERLIPEMVTPGRADNNLRDISSDSLALILRTAARDLGLAG
jgi:alcohol dehydrogenase